MTAAQIYLSFLCALGGEVIPSLLSQWMTEISCHYFPVYWLPFSQYGSARVHGMSGAGLWGWREKRMHTDAQSITPIPSHQVCPGGQTNLCRAEKRASQSRGLSVLAPAQGWLQALVITHLNSPVLSWYVRGNTQWLPPSLPAQCKSAAVLCATGLGGSWAGKTKHSHCYWWCMREREITVTVYLLFSI